MSRPLAPRLSHLSVGLDSDDLDSIEVFGGIGVVEEGVFHARWYYEALCKSYTWALDLGTLCPFCGRVEGSRNIALSPSTP